MYANMEANFENTGRTSNSWFSCSTSLTSDAVLTTIISWFSKNFLKRRRSVSSMLISILEFSLRGGIGLDLRERR